MCRYANSWRMGLLAWLTAAATSASAAAQDADVSQWIRELSGQSPAAWRTEAQLQAGYSRVIAELLPAAKSPYQNLEPIIVRAGAPGAEANRRAVVRAMLDRLAATDQPGERVFLLRQLAVVGRDDAVPAVAALMAAQPAWMRQFALDALERNPSAAAGKAIAAALADAKEPQWRLALVNALGRRRQSDATGPLSQLINNNDDAVARAAIMAMGNIASPEAARMLMDLAAKTVHGDCPNLRGNASENGTVPFGRKGTGTICAEHPSGRCAANGASPRAACERSQPVLARALLLCADRLRAADNAALAADLYRQVRATATDGFLHMAAVAGLAAVRPDDALPLVMESLRGGDVRSQAQAARLLLDMPGYQTTRAVLDLVPKLPDSVRPVLLEALFERLGPASGDPLLRAEALAAVKADDWHLSSAGVRALARVGTAADVPRLVAVATSGYWKTRQVALQSLTTIGAPGTDEAFLGLLDKADPKTRVMLIRALVARRAAVASDALVRIADDPAADVEVRLEARKALQALPDPKAAPRLVTLLVKSRSSEERELVERAIAASCQKIANPELRAEPVLAALRTADTAARCAILPALGRVGGAKALEAVRAAMGDPTPAMQDAGVRALANWPDASVADELCRVAAAQKGSRRDWALRGAARVVSSPRQMPPREAAAMLGKILAMTSEKETDVRKFILVRLAAVRTPESLVLAMSLLDDPQLHADAARAALRLAEALRYSNTADARRAMERLAREAKDENVRKQAATSLSKIAP